MSRAEELEGAVAELVEFLESRVDDGVRRRRLTERVYRALDDFEAERGSDALGQH